MNPGRSRGKPTHQAIKEAKESHERQRAIMGADIPEQARVLWWTLNDMQGDKDCCWPSEVDLCERLRWILRKVQRWIRYLKQQRIICIQYRNQQRKSSRYYVHHPERVLDADRKPRARQEIDAGKGGATRGPVTTPVSGAPPSPRQRRRHTPDTTVGTSRQRCRHSADSGVGWNVVKNVVTERDKNGNAPAAEEEDNGRLAGTPARKSGSADLPAGLRGLAEKTKLDVAGSLHLDSDEYLQVQPHLDEAICQDLRSAGGRARQAVEAMTRAADAAGRRCQADGISDPAGKLEVWRDCLGGQTGNDGWSGQVRAAS